MSYKMTDFNAIPLFTSIQPNIKRFIQGEECGAEYQAFCIQSWLEAGFKVYSLNNASEIALLKPLHPDVTFLEVQSKIPRITEFYDAGRKLEAGVMAIINADIVVKTEAGFVKDIAEISKEGLVIARRINIDSETFDIEILMGGIDFFMFNIDHIDNNIYLIFQEMNICIGEPWWDFILPIDSIVNNRKNHVIHNDFTLYHLNHIQQWNDKQHNIYKNMFYNIVTTRYVNHEINDRFIKSNMLFDAFCNSYINNNFVAYKNQIKAKNFAMNKIINRDYYYYCLYQQTQLKNEATITPEGLSQRQIQYIKRKAYVYFYLKLKIYKILFFVTKKASLLVKIRNIKAKFTPE